jgi:hypothetical protein
MKTHSMFLSQLLVISALVLSGCLGKDAGGITPTEDPDSDTGTVAEYTDVNRIVTVGAGLNFNASTGSWSEMNLNPVSKAPGLVYYDRTAVVSPVVGALKYAEITSSGAWNVEVIAANSPVTAITNTCGGAAASAACIGAPNVTVPTASQSQMFDLGYIDDTVQARPVVVYAYGTGGALSSATGKQIRIAERDENGKWLTSIAVSGTQLVGLTTGSVGPNLATPNYPITGLRLLVDDSNRLHVIFKVYAATANNSVYAYTMRSAAGTWTSPRVITTATPSTLTAVSGAPTIAATTGLVQAGAAWCKYNTGGSSADATGMVYSGAIVDNSPVASTQGFLLKCATVNVDGSCATWQGLDFVAGCAGACVSTTGAMAAATVNNFNRSDIAIDPVTGKILLSYFHSAPAITVPATLATGILTTQSAAACDSGLSTAAWSTVRAYPTAAQGTLGFRVSSDGTNHYLASLVAAAGSSLVVNKLSTALAANWNTTDQVTIEGTTNTVAGGFLYDAASGTIWGSYGALTAAGAGVLGQDIKAFAIFPGDINSTTGVVNNWYVDQTNFVTPATAIPMIDSAVAADGTVGFTYFYQEQGTTGPNSHLYYGIKGGGKLTPVFGERLVSNAINGTGAFMNGLHPSLAFDSQSNPAMAFLNQGVAANTGYLMVARSNNQGATFSLDRVDGGIAAGNNVGQYTSLDFTDDDTMGVAYYDYSTGATGQRLKFAKRTKNGGWRRYVVDGPGSANTNGCTTAATSTTGFYAKFLWSASGRPVIAYQSLVSGVRSLRLAFATEAEDTSTYTWSCLTLDTSLQGTNTRGEGIDMVLSTSDMPYIAHYDSGIGALRVVTCPLGTSVIHCGQTGETAFSGERLNYIIGTITSIASRPSIKIDSTDKIWLSYHGPADQGLFLTHKAAGANGAWSLHPETIDASPNNVSSTYTGHHATMTLNSNEKPQIFYRSFENWIRYFSRELDD